MRRSDIKNLHMAQLNKVIDQRRRIEIEQDEADKAALYKTQNDYAKLNAGLAFLNMGKDIRGNIVSNKRKLTYGDPSFLGEGANAAVINNKRYQDKHDANWVERLFAPLEETEGYKTFKLNRDKKAALESRQLSTNADKEKASQMLEKTNRPQDNTQAINTDAVNAAAAADARDVTAASNAKADELYSAELDKLQYSTENAFNTSVSSNFSADNKNMSNITEDPNTFVDGDLFEDSTEFDSVEAYLNQQGVVLPEDLSTTDKRDLLNNIKNDFFGASGNPEKTKKMIEDLKYGLNNPNELPGIINKLSNKDDFQSIEKIPETGVAPVQSSDPDVENALADLENLNVPSIDSEGINPDVSVQTTYDNDGIASGFLSEGQLDSNDQINASKLYPNDSPEVALDKFYNYEDLDTGAKDNAIGELDNLKPKLKPKGQTRVNNIDPMSDSFDPTQGPTPTAGIPANVPQKFGAENAPLTSNITIPDASASTSKEIVGSSPDDNSKITAGKTFAALKQTKQMFDIGNTITNKESSIEDRSVASVQAMQILSDLAAKKAGQETMSQIGSKASSQFLAKKGLQKGVKLGGKAAVGAVAGGVMGGYSMVTQGKAAGESWKEGDYDEAVLQGIGSVSGGLQAAGAGMMLTGIGAPLGAVLFGLGSAGSTISGVGQMVENIFDKQPKSSQLTQKSPQFSASHYLNSIRNR